jgi:acetyl-CoA C-acetyltransferase
MAEAFIIDAVRTPVGRRNGGLSGIHPADMAAHVIAETVRRTGIDSAEFDEVILGAIDQVGPQAMDIARTAWLAAGLSERVPGTTVERQCGSGQQAVSYAAQAVMSGTSDLVLAGGVQSMSSIPIGYANTAAQELGFPDPFTGSTGWAERYGDQTVSQFLGAEMMVDKWGLTRSELEDFAVESHVRALAAQAEGRFDREILPLNGITADEGPREPNRAKIESLAPLSEGGRLTAATSSQISDAAAVLLLASESAVRRYGLKPRARIHSISARGDDPIMMLSAPIEATRHALGRTGMSLDQMDLLEINEAFASVVLAWQRELDVDMDKVNVNGGGISLGHPIGATGARIMTTLLHELERTGGRYGLQTMCEGGGQANVTIIERLDEGFRL